jgi:hypothetical protein
MSPAQGRLWPSTDFCSARDGRHIAIFFFLWATDDNGATRRYVPCFGIKDLYQRHHIVYYSKRTVAVVYVVLSFEKLTVDGTT